MGPTADFIFLFLFFECGQQKQMTLENCFISHLHVCEIGHLEPMEKQMLLCKKKLLFRPARVALLSKHSRLLICYF
jgi:hypothetical protein